MGGRIEGVEDFRSASTAEFRDALVAWIEDRRSELEPPYRDHGSTDELLSHQRRVQQLLFDHGFMRWGWPVEVGGLGGNPLFRAVLGEELTGRGLVHSAAYSMTEVLGPGGDRIRRRHARGGGGASPAPRRRDMVPGVLRARGRK